MVILGPVIEFAGLSKRYGKTLAVDDLSFTVERGAVTGFLGPNGAGKTTTLRMLLGLVRPDRAAPRRSTAGATPTSRSPFETVGAVLEASGFHPGRSGRNHLRVLALRERASPDAASTRCSSSVGLTDAAGARVGGYSLGHAAAARARGGAARATRRCSSSTSRPTGSTRRASAGCATSCARSPREGRTVLVSSHVLAEVAQTVDDVVIINKGKLVAKAPVDELLKGGSQKVRVRGPQGQELASRIHAAGLTSMPDGDALVVTGATTDQVGDAVAGLTLHELSASASSLEEIFLELTAGSTPS